MTSTRVSLTPTDPGPLAVHPNIKPPAPPPAAQGAQQAGGTGPLHPEAVLIAHRDHRYPGGRFQNGGLFRTHGVPLGQPAHLGNAGLPVAHGGEPVVFGAAAAAQQDRARPHRVHAGKIAVHQGVGPRGVDGAGLKAGGVDGVQHPLELLELVLRLLATLGRER